MFKAHYVKRVSPLNGTVFETNDLPYSVIHHKCSYFVTDICGLYFSEHDYCNLTLSPLSYITLPVNFSGGGGLTFSKTYLVCNHKG